MSKKRDPEQKNGKRRQSGADDDSEGGDSRFVLVLGIGIVALLIVVAVVAAIVNTEAGTVSILSSDESSDGEGDGDDDGGGGEVVVPPDLEQYLRGLQRLSNPSDSDDFSALMRRHIEKQSSFLTEEEVALYVTATERILNDAFAVRDQSDFSSHVAFRLVLAYWWLITAPLPGTGLDRIGRSTTLIEEALALDRDNAWCWYLRSETELYPYLLAEQRGDRANPEHLERAARSMSQAIALAPGFYEAHNELAGIKLKLRDLTEARQHAWRAVTIKPDRQEYWQPLVMASLLQFSQTGDLDILADLDRKVDDETLPVPAQIRVTAWATMVQQLLDVVQREPERFSESEQAQVYHYGEKALAAARELWDELDLDDRLMLLAFDAMGAYQVRHDLEQSLARFQEALELDPTFDPACQGISQVALLSRTQDSLAIAVDAWIKNLRAQGVGEMDRSKLEFAVALLGEPQQMGPRQPRVCLLGELDRDRHPRADLDWVLGELIDNGRPILAVRDILPFAIEAPGSGHRLPDRAVARIVESPQFWRRVVDAARSLLTHDRLQVPKAGARGAALVSLALVGPGATDESRTVGRDAVAALMRDAQANLRADVREVADSKVPAIAPALTMIVGADNDARESGNDATRPLDDARRDALTAEALSAFENTLRKAKGIIAELLPHIDTVLRSLACGSSPDDSFSPPQPSSSNLRPRWTSRLDGWREMFTPDNSSNDDSSNGDD